MPRNVVIKAEVELVVQVKDDEEDVEVGNIMAEMEHDFSIFDGNKYVVKDSKVCGVKITDDRVEE